MREHPCDLYFKAFTFAKNRHEGQVDDTGKDYFNAHILPVAGIIEEVAKDDNHLQCAALLHDTLEDTNTTYKELELVFNKDIADLVKEVTHKGKKDHYGYYYPNLKTKRGIMLKFADRLSNISRMESWKEDRQRHYLKKSKFWKSEPPKTKENDNFLDLFKKIYTDFLKDVKQIKKPEGFIADIKEAQPIYCVDGRLAGIVVKLKPDPNLSVNIHGEFKKPIPRPTKDEGGIGSKGL